MITETLYVGRNNTFSLQLLRGDEPENLMAINGYELFIGDFPPFTDDSCFIEKANGVVEINIAPLLTKEFIGSHKAYLVTYDPVNTNGVRWPDFKLKIK